MKKKQSTSVPSMDELMTYLNKQTGLVNKRQIVRDFHIKGDDRQALKMMIRDLREKGLLQTESGSRRIKSRNILDEITTLEITGIDSMGDLVARPLEWLSKDQPPQIIITQNLIKPPAGVGDIVRVRVKNMGKNYYEGSVLKRITQSDNRMVGVYDNGRVYPVDRRLTQGFIVDDLPRDVYNKDLLIIEIPPIHSRSPKASFVRRIGSANDPFSATLIAIYLHNLPIAFLEQTEKEASKVKVPKASEEHPDWTHIPFVTIDGEDARDFDDAVWAEQDQNSNNPNGWHLCIGIADVSWYVRSGMAMDTDAKLRGNSVYFPDRVLPMLPFELSNGVCSLKPGEPRAALVCEIWLNAHGKKIKHRFIRALIRSERRLTYSEVQASLEGSLEINGLEKEIKALQSVYQLLKKQRQKRGVLEINVPEPEIKLNAEGKILQIKNRERLTSMELIEELMILANVSAAETLEEKKAPTMYRVHDRPSSEKVEQLNKYLRATGLTNISVDETSDARAYNSILSNKNARYNFALNEYVLRSQSQAVYSPENIGHFGLALQKYAHFTSPIRRYADILVHRSLVKALKLGEGALTVAEEENFSQIAQHISQTERQAAAAERDADDRYIALYLSQQTGKTFNARIVSVTRFGLFIRLENPMADGFVPMRNIPGGFYDFEEEMQRLYNPKTGDILMPGDNVQATLIEATPLTGGLIFKIVLSKKKHKIQKNSKKKERIPS